MISYQEWLEEHYTKIPIYTKEWTNRSPSDPGITILEVLTAFLVRQQEQIDDVPDAARKALLALMGFSAKKGSCAKVLIEASGVQRPDYLLANQRFGVGDISFETAASCVVPQSRIIGVFREDEAGVSDCSHILDKDVRLPVYLFGKTPRAGGKLYLVMDQPILQGAMGTIQIELDGQEARNPCAHEFPVCFAKLQWECYTQEGFVPMEVLDGTNGFLASGQLTFRQPMGPAAVYDNGHFRGYVWRGVLEWADYDVAPVADYMTGFLIALVQKETLGVTFAFSEPCGLVLECAMAQDACLCVFCREEEGASYRRYEECGTQVKKGRFYEKEQLGYGRYAVRFDKSRYGYAPVKTKNAVRLVLYTEELMQSWELGEVYGYDNQQITLPKKHLAAEPFMVLTKQILPDGEAAYDFFAPECRDSYALFYELDENEGTLVIRDAGDYIGARLYLASIAVTHGGAGNVREGNRFRAKGALGGMQASFFNPVCGSGGAFGETPEEVRKRFVMDYNTPRTAVTAADYEALVKRTPGLCIAKVHAWLDTDKNEVQIAVLPKLRTRFARLSDCYEQAIVRWLWDKRLLSTRFKIRQPVYAGVSVHAVIYVKPHYMDCQKQIEHVFAKSVDYTEGTQQFGEELCFDKIVRAVAALECVASIGALRIAPQNTTHAVMHGENIVPADDCLLYVGEMKLELLPASESKP